MKILYVVTQKTNVLNIFSTNGSVAYDCIEGAKRRAVKMHDETKSPVYIYEVHMHLTAHTASNIEVVDIED